MFKAARVQEHLGVGVWGHIYPGWQKAWRYVACVAWRFWLGALSNKGGRGQRNREEIGAEATFSRGFAARSRALRVRISLLRRSCARLDKTAMLRRLGGT